MSKTNERAFEDAIDEYLINHDGYVKGLADNFNKESSLDVLSLISFIKSTQRSEWEKLSEVHGKDVEPKFISRLIQELENRGMLDCLRNGITDYGKKFKLAYFKPVSKLNPETQVLYDKNILTVTRQVHYSTRDESSIDMLLSINGLPVVTMELKNAFTNQTVENACCGRYVKGLAEVCKSKCPGFLLQ